MTLYTVNKGIAPEQVAFRNALLNLWTYSTTQEDYMLFSTRFWDVLSPEQHSEFDNALHLLPTRAAVLELNKHCLGAIGQPVICCKAKHNHPEAKKASEEDAEGLETEILLAEGARVMLTRNLWTSKGASNNCSLHNYLIYSTPGLVNGSRGVVKKIWFNQNTTPQSHLPAVVFVQFDGYTGMAIHVNNLTNSD